MKTSMVLDILNNQINKLTVELNNLDNNNNAFQCDKDMTYGALCGITKCYDLIKLELY